MIKRFKIEINVFQYKFISIKFFYTIYIITILTIFYFMLLYTILYIYFKYKFYEIMKILNIIKKLIYEYIDEIIQQLFMSINYSKNILGLKKYLIILNNLKYKYIYIENIYYKIINNYIYYYVNI